MTPYSEIKDRLKIGTNMAVTLEALPRDVKVGMQLYDENGNAFEIVGIGTMTWQAAERGEIELLIKGGSPLGKRLKLA